MGDDDDFALRQDKTAQPVFDCADVSLYLFDTNVVSELAKGKGAPIWGA